MSVSNLAGDIAAAAAAAAAAALCDTVMLQGTTLHDEDGHSRMMMPDKSYMRMLRKEMRIR